MVMHPYQQQIDLCNRAVEAVRFVISAELHADVHNYINRHDEWGLGIETLIAEINEMGIRLTIEQLELIQVAMASMGMAESQELRYLVVHNVWP